MAGTYTLLFAESVVDGRIQDPVLEGADPAYADRLKRAGTERMLPGWLRGLQSGTVTDRAAMQRDGDFARSAFFDYVVRPEGRFHCLITTPYVTPTQRFHMIVGRPINQDDFSPEDVRVLRALLPHVGRLIASGKAVAQATAERAVLASALDGLKLNLAMVSEGCHLVFANRGARRLLAMQDGLHMSGTVLTAADPATRAGLRQAVNQALRSAEAGGTTIRVGRPSGLPPFDVTAMRLSEAPGPFGLAASDPSLTLLLIGEPVARAVPSTALARSHGLTARECSLALLLARGHSIRDAAGLMGIGYNTARYHLRHVFEKTGTHRQSALVRLVLAPPH